MTSLLLTLINVLILTGNVAILHACIKVYTEITKTNILKERL